jgi:hypothetical protein
MVGDVHVTTRIGLKPGVDKTMIILGLYAAISK